MKDRMDLVNQQRQRRQQRINSIGILFGVVFTAGSLTATALSLRTTQEGQITDRYTKATEQLGSAKRDVRTAAIYALERIAADSRRDRITIRDVLAAFVREHDPALVVKDTALPNEPDTDVQAALTVLARRSPDPPKTPALDLHNLRTPHTLLFKARLYGSNMSGSDLTGSDLTGSDLTDANLSGAHLIGAHLADADLTDADLTDADLSTADLTGAHLTADLAGAHLIGADLAGANLIGADLIGADLAGANLTGAHLYRANLTEADLSGANLHGLTGMTAEQIRKTAKTDGSTRF